ncbi:hypothetical protein [Natronolimnohabitans innermongolicus]|uniref:Uncharacterized protein n=1 Tax=Natronolimnohabitans innermongolicus JCM 12255 TaxID=1227499 RepID=L9XE07_9EURY|nr:hypothetical protein [Natronolimnohabitans innermongolicus]ELY59950.1 hypothetical protein C493_04708 [Natronolimnohabitans innermongolicus JCM 12255]
MVRVRRTLVGVALIGWSVALVSHLAALEASDEPTRTRWTNRRNRFLLVSSVAMNTTVGITAYRYGNRLRAALA